MYEIKIKHLKDTINRAGDFDDMEFEFPAQEVPEMRKSIADPEAIKEEINSEFLVNNQSIKLDLDGKDNDKTLIASNSFVQDDNVPAMALLSSNRR